jgi:hypothetical protein
MLNGSLPMLQRATAGHVETPRRARNGLLIAVEGVAQACRQRGWV